MRPPIAFQLIVFLALFAKTIYENMYEVYAIAIINTITHELGFLGFFFLSSNSQWH